MLSRSRIPRCFHEELKLLSANKTETTEENLILVFHLNLVHMLNSNHRFSDDFKVNRSWLVPLNSFKIRSEIWRPALI